MRRRIVALAAAALLALGVAVAVWAARSDDAPVCTDTTYGVPDPVNAKVMTYHRKVCD
jgi:hypothetical protein